MNTLSEEQYVRAQKVRKQELYRNMLDQQVRLNEDKREKQIQSLRHPFSDGRHVAQHRHSIQLSPDQNKYLPPIIQQPTRESQWKPQNKLANTRVHTEDDKTETYLNNCEEIIRNLRELKGKKKQWENYGAQLESLPKKQAEKDMYRNYQIQYYPKPSYFSSSGSAYNKNVGIESASRQIKVHSTRLNTLDEPKLSNQKYSKKQSTSKNPKNKKLEKISHPYVQNEVVTNSQEKERYPESESPQGIREESKLPKKQSKLRHKLLKLSNKREFESPSQQAEHNEIPSIEQQNEQKLEKEEEKKRQTQLAQCLVELTKYLRKLNEKQQEKKSLRSQWMDSQQPYIKLFSKQEQKQEATKDYVKESLKEKTQQKKKENYLKPMPEDELSLLKSKVITALKKVSLKSYSLLLKMSDRTMSKSPKLQQMDQIRYSVRSPQLKQTNDRIKSDNDELAKLLITHIDKHDDNTQELNRCLKELHEYLKNQNDDIRQLKSYRDIQIINEQSNRNSASKLTKGSPPKNQSSVSKHNRSNSLDPAVQRQMQEAILKNLKKARLRGNAFKERIQAYKKQHPFQEISERPHKRAKKAAEPQQIENTEIPNNAQVEKVSEKVQQNPINVVQQKIQDNPPPNQQQQ